MSLEYHDTGQFSYYVSYGRVDVTVSVQRGGVFCKKKPPSHLADLHVEN